MFGLILKIKTAPGKSRELAKILDEAFQNISGNLTHDLAIESAHPDILWVTETWKSKRDHSACLELPAVKEAMARGRPLIEEIIQRVETEPLNG